MQLIHFPLLCWPLPGDLVVGRILGTDHQLVAEDSHKLRGAFSSFLQKQLKTEEVYFLELDRYQLKGYDLSVKPRYEEEGKMYPLKAAMQVRIHAVYGPNEQGFFECYLPQFEQEFYYYQASDLDRLATHFAQDSMRAMTPEQLCRYLLPGEPWLDTLPVKRPPRKKARASQARNLDLPTLLTAADRLPFPRKARNSFLPQTAWERGTLVDQLGRLLLTDQRNLLLVGNPGVGKSAVLEELIRKLHTRTKKDPVHQRPSFWRSTPARIVAKARYLGEWQLICEQLVEELEMANGYLWIEDVIALIGTGGEGPEDSMAAFLTPFLRSGQLRLLGELTPPQVEAMRRLLPGFLDHFQVVDLPEMNALTTRNLGTYFNDALSQQRNIAFTPEALQMSYDLLDRFVRYERFPGKLMRFLGRCAQQAYLTDQQHIDTVQVIQQFTEQTGMPQLLLRDDLPLNPDDLRAFFLDRIKGQDQVIDHLITLIKVFKAGLNDPDKPIASLIFAGPTGVGKTATAKALADFLFGLGQSYQPFIRLDMSEFQHPAQIQRLIGPQGKLIQHVRQRPFGVVLLDEIEKAHPVIFDALLTALDEGLLVDAVGRATDFRNAIIIMTTNLGATQRRSLGFAPQAVDSYDADIKGFFRPEFVNRIDRVLVFHPLDQATIRAISLLELTAIAERDGMAQRGLRFTFSEALVDHVAEVGFDHRYGARPLQREVERVVIAPLARHLLAHPEWRDQTLHLDLANDRLRIEAG